MFSLWVREIQKDQKIQLAVENREQKGEDEVVQPTSQNT